MARQSNSNPDPDKDQLISVPMTFTLTIKEYAIELFPELADVELTAEMESVLWSLERGNTLLKTCESLGIPRPLAEYWKAHNRLFAECYRLLMQIRSSDMEDQLLSDGVKGRLKELSRMFAIKGNLPQYRDNYLPPPSGISNLTIMLDGREISTVAGLLRDKKDRPTVDITPDDQDDQD